MWKWKHIWYYRKIAERKMKNELRAELVALRRRIQIHVRRLDENFEMTRTKTVKGEISSKNPRRRCEEDWKRLNLNLIGKIWRGKSASNSSNPVSFNFLFFTSIHLFLDLQTILISFWSAERSQMRSEIDGKWMRDLLQPGGESGFVMMQYRLFKN